MYDIPDVWADEKGTACINVSILPVIYVPELVETYPGED